MHKTTNNTTNMQEPGLKQLPEEVFDVLKATDVALLFIKYDGAEGNERIIGMGAQRKDEKEATLVVPPGMFPPGREPADLETWLQHLMWRLLKHHFMGFGRGDGAYGSLNIDVDRRIAAIRHQERRWKYVPVSEPPACLALAITI
jgi:hypothetical protein